MFSYLYNVSVAPISSLVSRFLPMSSAVFSGKWLRKSAGKLISIITFTVFFILDFLDAVFCIIYRYLDECLEGKTSPCYCGNRGQQGNNVIDGEEGELSETLYGRKNIFREMGFLKFPRKWENSQKRCCGGEKMVNRWSDCGCNSCVSWVKSNGDHRLHLIVKEPSLDPNEDFKEKPTENVIFLHGFLSSSSFWTQTVFPTLLEQVNGNYRLVAVDLLGFGRSPKPRDCFYTLRDHLEMIEKSAIEPLHLSSFHLVAHSMGCIIALALAAKHSKSVKSVTLVAPPYFSSLENGASLNALERLAEKKLWPPLSFGSSFMSWYEHLGRCVCFLFCQNHRNWEWILKFITRKRDLDFMISDLSRHTHHSAWHSMHNVICGGAKFMDRYLGILTKAGVKISVVQGDQDQVVPIECCKNFKLKAPDIEVNIVRNADHGTVIFGREEDFAQNLGCIWTSLAADSARKY
ncbi:Alpha/beta hydrolase fold [Quillaja saponaria]|uniref:Alpha/beta hydrolase fold n=1 Tax=Quillaja saponaria TaxID=32244 RepID=A0AAD7Q7S4_QUISA|nr:Alpha/beta hydrolase fold [Quillaja saponaria]